EEPKDAKDEEVGDEGDYMEDEDLLDDEPDFDVLVGVVSILPMEYDVPSEVNEEENGWLNYSKSTRIASLEIITKCQ
ncbi:hypothetical protein A2U01_0098601, partial [Trifolium medium]|nr:hypothetical protein [Trifolium medium]